MHELKVQAAEKRAAQPSLRESVNTQWAASAAFTPITRRWEMFYV